MSLKEQAQDLADALVAVSEHLLAPPHIALYAQSLSSELLKRAHSFTAAPLNDGENVIPEWGEWSVTQLGNEASAQTDCCGYPFVVSRCTDPLTGEYRENALSKAQVFLAQHEQFLPKDMRAALTISPGMLQWATCSGPNDSTACLESFMRAESIRRISLGAANADTDADEDEDEQNDGDEVEVEEEEEEKGEEIEEGEEEEEEESDGANDKCESSSDSDDQENDVGNDKVEAKHVRFEDDVARDEEPTTLRERQLQSDVQSRSTSYSGAKDAQVQMVSKRDVKWAGLKKLKHKLRPSVVVGIVIWLILVIFALLALYQFL